MAPCAVGKSILLSTGFPYGTVIANVLACIGVFLLANPHSLLQGQDSILPAWGAKALTVGLMGSLSTVSTFAVEVRV